MECKTSIGFSSGPILVYIVTVRHPHVPPNPPQKTRASINLIFEKDPRMSRFLEITFPYFTGKKLEIPSTKVAALQFS